MGDVRDDFPTRAAEVFRNATTRVSCGGCAVELRPFTIRRVAMLHSVESPLFYSDGRWGLGAGWCATAYVMAGDAAELADTLAHGGAAALVRAALEWADGLADFELVALCAQTLKDSWSRIMALDPPDLDGGGEGNAPRPATVG